MCSWSSKTNRSRGAPACAYAAGSNISIGLTSKKCPNTSFIARNDAAMPPVLGEKPPPIDPELPARRFGQLLDARLDLLLLLGLRRPACIRRSRPSASGWASGTGRPCQRARIGRPARRRAGRDRLPRFFPLRSICRQPWRGDSCKPSASIRRCARKGVRIHPRATAGC